MNRKVGILSLISILLVADALAAVRPLRTHLGLKPRPANGWTWSPAHTKAVESICKPTTYKERCIKWLGKVPSDDPQVLIKSAVLLITKQSLNKAINFTDGMLAKFAKGERNVTKRAIDYCKKELDSGVKDLQPFIDQMGNDVARYLNDNYYKLRLALSSIYSYQMSCLDDVSEKNLNEVMGNGILHAQECTSNAMAIVKYASEIFASFGIKCDVPSDL